MPPILQTRSHPEGQPLEEVLPALRRELEIEAMQLHGDPDPAVQFEHRNLLRIVGLLLQAEATSLDIRAATRGRRVDAGDVRLELVHGAGRGGSLSRPRPRS